jgi:excisionase family DNA binding protein
MISLNLMSKADAASFAGVSHRTLERALHADGVIPIRIGRRVLIDRAHLEAWLNAKLRSPSRIASDV